MVLAKFLLNDGFHRHVCPLGAAGPWKVNLVNVAKKHPFMALVSGKGFLICCVQVFIGPEFEREKEKVG